jgi:hypothetical protein
MATREQTVGLVVEVLELRTPQSQEVRENLVRGMLEVSLAQQALVVGLLEVEAVVPDL